MSFKSALFVFFFLLSIPFFARADGPKPKIANAWIREVLPAQNQTAAYMVIENPNRVPDFLTSASCNCTETMEIHAMIHTGGMMKMEPVKRLEVPGGGKVELMPGGTHIMLFGVKTALKDGAKAVLTLHFERAGDVQVEAVVRASEGKKDAH